MSEVLTMHVLTGHLPEPDHKPFIPCKLAQAHICRQPWEQPFPPEEGLCMGTVFPSLSKPYAGWRKLPFCQ